MLNTLSGRLATMLAAMFAVVAALLVGVSQRMPDLHQVIELGSMLLAAAIAFALLAALLVFNLLTRRLHRLAQAMEAFRDSGGIILGCNLAFGQMVGIVAKAEKLKQAEAREQALQHLMPGVTLMPSGIFAVARAQAAGCVFVAAA